MYDFLNTPEAMVSLISRCGLANLLGENASSGSAQIFGEDASYPDLIHFYPTQRPLLNDPHRLIMIKKTTFEYVDI